jgi:PPE-repeat protein
MYFAALPPEINSALMYSGAGAGPLLGAAAAWSSLASELSANAAAYTSVIGGLNGSWSGPSDAAMSASASRYVMWMTQTADMAVLTSGQATQAATAYLEAFAMTVPPPVIAANRTLLSALVATNFLGINTPAIMATEAHYMEMWAQDVTAMMGYQTQSAAATSALPPFTPPAPTTTGVPAAAVTGAGLGGIFAPGSNQATTGLAGLLNLISGESGSAFGSFINSQFLNTIGSSQFLNPGATLAPLLALAALLPAFSQAGSNQQQADLAQRALEQQELSNELQALQNGYPRDMFGDLNQRVAALPTASMGSATSVGGLSVPSSWSGNNINAVGAAGRPLSGGMPLGMMPLMAGAQRAGSKEKVKGMPTKSVVPRHPSGG